MNTLDVALLGGFAVSVDGARLATGAFPQRRAADLVKVLALAPGHRAPRDAVVEALWPHLGVEAGIANLHKAAHHARRALGDRDAVVLRQGVVALAPAAAVTTDVERFEAGDDAAYGGELLPDDRYEPWTLETRERLRARALEALRRQGRWADLLAEEPADEEAHRALMREHAARGDLTAAARQFRALREELARLGLRPSAEVVALHDELCFGPAVQVRPQHAGPLLGREDELAMATRALADAADGHGGALMVTGDAGIGKTRFVDAVLHTAAQRGRHVLRSAARTAEGATPYRPLAEALEPLLAERPDLVAGLSEATQRVLGLLAPVTAGGGRGTARGQEVLGAIGRLLSAAAQERGVVLAIEDLHRADETTLRVLHFLVAAARRERLLVILTGRPDEGGDGLLELRRALAEQGATEVALGELPADRVRPLVLRAARQPLPDATVDAVVAAAAGNPFFAQELAAAADRSTGMTLPPRLDDLLTARLEPLDAATPGLADALAVLDDGCSIAELAEITALEPVAVERALRAAVGTVGRSGDGWRLRHPLLREAARRRLPVDRLAAVHREAAACLRRRGAAPETVAAHLLAGGREAEAVPLLREAAAAAARVGAFADGARWVDLALPHAADADRGALLELLGDLRLGTGDARAAAAYAAARDGAPAAARPRLSVKEARAHVALGDLAAAQAAVESAGDGHEHGRDRLIVQGLIAWHRGDYAEARRHADAAARAPDDGPAGVAPDSQLYSLLAMVAHSEGRWEHTMRAQLADAWHIPELAGRVLDAYLCVTEYMFNAGDPADTLMGFARELHAQARSAGAQRGLAFAETVRGEAELLGGDAGAAREHLGEAVRLSRTLGAVGGESLARVRLAEALAADGHRLEARAQLEEALELAHTSSLAGHLLFLVHAPLIRTAATPGDAMVLVDRAEALLDPRPTCRFCPVEYYVAAGIACAQAGDTERARGFLARAEESPGLWPGSPRAAAVAEARGELLRAEGQDADAHVAFLRAADGYGAAGHRLHEHRVRELLAVAA